MKRRVQSWLEYGKNIDLMESDSAEIEKVIEALADMPLRIESLSKGLDKTFLHLRSEEESWSPNDILAHMRACADVWGKSIMAMISQDHPTLRYISPRTWIRKTNYPDLDFHVSLEAFSKQRNELLDALKPLKTSDWSRGATFRPTTRGKKPTILSYARRIARHENEHYAQLADLLKGI